MTTFAIRRAPTLHLSLGARQRPSRIRWAPTLVGPMRCQPVGPAVSRRCRTSPPAGRTHLAELPVQRVLALGGAVGAPEHQSRSCYATPLSAVRLPGACGAPGARRGSASDRRDAVCPTRRPGLHLAARDRQAGGLVVQRHREGGRERNGRVLGPYVAECGRDALILISVVVQTPRRAPHPETQALRGMPVYNGQYDQDMAVAHRKQEGRLVRARTAALGQDQPRKRAWPRDRSPARGHVDASRCRGVPRIRRRRGGGTRNRGRTAPGQSPRSTARTRARISPRAWLFCAVSWCPPSSHSALTRASSPPGASSVAPKALMPLYRGGAWPPHGYPTTSRIRLLPVARCCMRQLMRQDSPGLTRSH